MIELPLATASLFDHIKQLIAKNSTKRKHLAYDFNDPKQYEFAQFMASLNKAAVEYPGRLKTLEKIRQYQIDKGVQTPAPHPSGWQNMFMINGLGFSSANGNISANSFATIVDGYGSINLTLIIIDKQNQSIIAHGFANDFNNTFLTVATSNSNSKASDVEAYLHYSYTSKKPNGELDQHSPGSSGVVKRDFSDVVTKHDPSIKAPIRRSKNPYNSKTINIGLGRHWSDQGENSHFDYAWNEPTQDHPIGKIPFVGHVIFAHNIKSPIVAKSSIYLDIYVADKTGGGGTELTPTELDSVVYPAFSIDSTNAKQLNWSLPAGKSTADPGNPIKFGHVSWPSDTVSYFYCGITIELENGNLGFAEVQSIDSADSNSLDGTLYIKPIEFIWHCIAEGSQVTMADGSQRAIELIVANDIVLSENGPVTVAWTNRGVHKGAVIKIATDSGQDLVCSDKHVVVTTAGPKMTQDIEVGDVIQADQPTKVTTTERVANWEGVLCNLATQVYQQPEQDGQKLSTFFANGLLVGDVNTQRYHQYRQRNDKDRVKCVVHSYLHPDVDAFFAEKLRVTEF